MGLYIWIKLKRINKISMKIFQLSLLDRSILKTAFSECGRDKLNDSFDLIVINPTVKTKLFLS